MYTAVKRDTIFFEFSNTTHQHTFGLHADTVKSIFIMIALLKNTHYIVVIRNISRSGIRAAVMHTLAHNLSFTFL